MLTQPLKKYAVLTVVRTATILRSPEGEIMVRAHMRPVATLHAGSANDALRIAKQKGFVAPIIGEHNVPTQA